ncbi:MAG TPA: hypothetical protein VHZ03_05355 [Trebonia sp.]|jgi:hypothetical protein|nr:hypothetical protein [Trebonia sp.]
MTGVDPRAWQMSEDSGPDSLEAHLRALLKDLGLWGYHPRNSIGSEKGWPDWVILGPRGALFRELKSERGQLTPEQRSVGARLVCAGLDWSTWRPRDLFSGVIAAQLLAIAGYDKEAA